LGQEILKPTTMLSTLATILLFPTLVTSGSTSYYAYSIQEQSWISISGSSNVSTFECYSNSNFTKGIIHVNTNEFGNTFDFSDALMHLEIESFDCKNPLLNKDLYKALGAKENPNILIELQNAEFLPTKNQDQVSGYMNVSLAITINGKCKIVNMPVNWIKANETDFRFIGSYDINMTDFEITPPSPAFGLVKVNEWITINFNLAIKASSPNYADIN
jgi:hypothetical protein